MSMQKRPKTGKLYPPPGKSETFPMYTKRITGTDWTVVSSIKDLDLNNGAYNEAHHLLELKEVPDSLTHLRQLFTQPENKDIRDYAIQGNTFEECIARTATFLNIALDGEYDVGPLCEVLCNAITSRKAVGQLHPHLADSRLVEAEIVEREGDVTLQKVEKIEKIEKIEIPKLTTEIN